MKRKKTVHRTLVLAGGEIATQAAQALPAMLAERAIPGDAVAICNSDTQGVLTAEQIDAALTSIAQLETQAALATQGWSIARDAELDIVLLLDVVPEADGWIATWLDQVARQTRKQLGLSIAPLLLCLVPADAAAETTAACLHAAENNAQRLVRGAYVVGMTTEDSLRLKDSDTLMRKATELLYAIVASPLRDAVTILAQERETHALGTLGVAVWRWQPQAARRRLMALWLQDVMAHWSSTAVTDSAEAHARHWLDEAGGHADALRTHLASRLPATPHLTASSWRLPWPWRLRSLWHAIQEIRATGSAQGQGGGETAGALWAVEAGRRMREMARARLDDQPVGGIATLVQIGMALEAACHAAEESAELRRFQHEQQLQRTTEQIATLDAEWDIHARRWPQATVGSWLRSSIAFWRWPRLIRCYRRMQQLGQQAARASRHWFDEQAACHVAQAEGTAWQQLARELDHLLDQVQEIGEMLASLSAEMADSVPNPPVLSAGGAAHGLSDATYERLYALGQFNLENEARVAAEQIGGLGQQLDALEETFMPALTALAETRCNWIDNIPPRALLVALYPDGDALLQWQRLTVASAAPLWRYDDAGLAEQARAEAAQLVWLCQAGNGDPVIQTDGDLPPVSVVAGNDPHELILLRARHGLPAAAMSHVFQE